MKMHAILGGTIFKVRSAQKSIILHTKVFFVVFKELLGKRVFALHKVRKHHIIVCSFFHGVLFHHFRGEFDQARTAAEAGQHVPTVNAPFSIGVQNGSFFL